MTTHRLQYKRALLWLGLWFLALTSHADTPQWIWHDNHGAKTAPGEVRYFRKEFNARSNVEKAILSCAADDHLEIYLNGKKVMDESGWAKAVSMDVTKDIHRGTNVLAIRGVNDTELAAVIVTLDLAFSKRSHETIITDTSWRSSATEEKNWTQRDFDTANWTPVVSLGNVGTKPWGDVFAAPQATPADQLTLLPGFKAELIHSAQPWEGSWVCMTIDPKGRLIISPQQGVKNLLRVTLSKQGRVEKIENIDLPVGSAMGLLYAFDSLYVNGQGPSGLGLYRLHYNHHLDKFDEVTLLKNIKDASGEHGSHAVVLGPDKHLYIVSGNFTKVPTDILPTSPHKNFAEDQLLPRAEDGNGFGVGIKPPGGFILRTDKDGKQWELYCAGMRNTYDFAFNPDGEMFGFDSDMEWDWGLPWYRPIRFCHLVSGGDYGFREGSGKWPKYYPDSLPSAVDVGIGSPTGLKFGTDSNFPEKYKTALYGLDWAYGRIFAVHFTPKGATYDATFDTFLKGKPLNLTDIEFGHDGAMYFITGGRGTQSGLYRVTYDGPKLPEENVPSHRELKAAEHARELRHKLEAFQGKQNPKTIKFAWPYLNSDDRFIRYAARIAIESQPVMQWQDRALSETRTNAGLTALLALARCGGKETQTPLLQALAKFPLDGLDESQKLAKLRVIELSFIRQGHPDADMTKFVMDKLDRHYPADDEWLNRELSELLIYLHAPDAVEKTLALLDKAPTQEEQIHYILHLRKLTNDWTLDQHEHYFNWFDHRDGRTNHPAAMLKWFADADRDYADGSSFPKYIANMRKDAIDSLTPDERTSLASVIAEKKPEEPKPTVAVRKFVRQWVMADLQPQLDQVTHGRSFARGKEVFTAAQCFQCHRFDNQGGAVGPELTAIASRFNHHDILESILEPSKVISEQYVNTTVFKKDGDDVTGRLLEENDQHLVLLTDPLKQTKVTVLKSDVQSRQISKVSPMPEGLMNNFTQDEILDLIAYLESGGKETAAAFEKK
ncbi:MAG TPA: c-type cytochrome [Verrucomicrobiae bacterium]|jgi:putative heme-binding domain-containing protein|nr:c-type cytochrome [Verrucomicrobiae bacterium]